MVEHTTTKASETAPATRQWRLAAWVPLALLSVILLVIAVIAAWPEAPVGGVFAWFQPGVQWMSALIVASWTASLVAFAVPRRREGRPLGVIAVVGLATLAVIGGLASFGPRSGAADLALTPLWRTLRLFTGDPAEPLWEGGAPVALQVARFTAVAATFSTAALAAFVLWRRQITRVRMRLVTFSDLVIGADEGGTELVKELVADPKRDASRSIGVVVRPGTPEDVLKDLAASGALVTELDVGQQRFAPTLLAFMTHPSWKDPRTWLGPSVRNLPAAVDRIYVLASDPAEATQLTTTVSQLLEKASTASSAPYIQVVVGVDDIDAAQAVRMRFLRSPVRVAIDAMSAVEVTAAEQVGRVLRSVATPEGKPQDVTLVVCGDTPLTRAVLAEVDRRAREQDYLRTGAGTQPHGLENWDAQPERQGQDEQDLITRAFSIRRVVVVDELASRIVRQRDAEAFGAATSIVRHDAVDKPWPASVEDVVTGLAADGLVAVMVTSAPDERSYQVASRLAGRGVPVWVRTDRRHLHAGQPTKALHEYRLSLLFDGWLPETTWTRVARLKHERYRRRHFPPAAERSEDKSLKVTRRPWWHGGGENHRLPRQTRDDNVAQVRRLMAILLERGYSWQLLGPRGEHGFRGCFFELGQKEHDRWREANCQDGSRNDFCTEWADLDDYGREHNASDVNATLHALEVHGLRPIAPPDTVGAGCQDLVTPTGDVPACASCDRRWMESGYAYRFRRTGEVTADQLSDDREWTTANGDVLHGRAGDWLVTGPDGSQRTVTPGAFAASYEPVGGEPGSTSGGNRYRRTGLVRARRATTRHVVHTQEGVATAQPGDWVLTRLDDQRQLVAGDTWPVPDDEFRSAYTRDAPRL